MINKYRNIENGSWRSCIQLSKMIHVKNRLENKISEVYIRSFHFSSIYFVIESFWGAIDKGKSLLRYNGTKESMQHQHQIPVWGIFDL